MANILHSTLTGSELHEPKGIDALTGGASDADKVYVSDGAGSGAWTTTSRYGELYITGGATTQALTTVSARLDPGTVWTENIASGITTTAADGTFTIAADGVYQLHFWISFNTDSVATGTLYTFYYAVNGTPNARSFSVQKLTAGVDRLTGGAFGIASFTAGQVLSIYAKSSTNSTITPVEAGFIIHLL